MIDDGYQKVRVGRVMDRQLDDRRTVIDEDDF